MGGDTLDYAVILTQLLNLFENGNRLNQPMKTKTLLLMLADSGVNGTQDFTTEVRAVVTN